MSSGLILAYVNGKPIYRTFGSVGLDCSERLFGPSVLFHDLGLLLGGEIVLDVEELTNFLNALALDEGGDLRTRKLKKRLDIQVVSSHYDLEEHFLVDVDKISVPLIDNLRHVRGAERFLDLRRCVLSHVLTENDDLLHDGLVDLGDWNLVIGATVLDQSVD